MNNNIDLPKKVNAFDRIRIKLRKILGYRDGEKFTFDIKPEIKTYSDIQLMKLANTEEKLKQILASNNERHYAENGIEESEAKELLEWTVQNARKYLVDEGKDIKEESLLGHCGLGQGITATTLINMGLKPYVVNVNPTLSKLCGRHAYVTVEIPIKTGDKTVNKMFLIDTTYKQFFLRAYVTNQYGAWINDKRFGGKVAPLAGYWTLNMGKHGKDFSEELLSKGFIELTDENAKIYGDSFVLEAIDRKDNSKVPSKKEIKTGISGAQYLANITNPNNQEEIDYDEGELDEYYGINVSTPLMQKKKNMEKNNTLDQRFDPQKEKTQDIER